MTKNTMEEWEKRFDERFVKKQDILSATIENPVIIPDSSIPRLQEVKSFIRAELQRQKDEWAIELQKIAKWLESQADV